MTEAVLDELAAGVPVYPSLQAVLDSDWLDHVHVDGLPELGVVAEYARVLGSSRTGDDRPYGVTGKGGIRYYVRRGANSWVAEPEEMRAIARPRESSSQEPTLRGE